jgi:hypothetical protein
MLDVAFLRHWIRNFYNTNLWLMAAVYLSLCIVAVAFCMGVPVGTFLLGLAAGVYIGRREHHQQVDGARAMVVSRRVAVFAAFVTTAAALPIGLLALQSEREILDRLENILGLGQNSLRGGGGFMLIGFLCILLLVMQYCGSRMAGDLAFRIGMARLNGQQ